MLVIVVIPVVCLEGEAELEATKINNLQISDKEKFEKCYDAQDTNVANFIQAEIKRIEDKE